MGQRKEVEYDVRKWSTLEYQNLQEFEYHGEMEAEANMAGSLVDSTEPCPRTLVRDCDGQCAPAFWIGNGLCDNGGKAKVGATKSCKEVVAAQCEKGVDGKWWTKKGATKNAADAYLMKECTKKCNAATGMKDRVMKWSGCTWIMPKLADYGVAKHHGVYNFNCPQFWNDGGDCLSEARIVNRRAWYRHRWFQRKALKMPSTPSSRRRPRACRLSPWPPWPPSPPWRWSPRRPAASKSLAHDSAPSNEVRLVVV